jgi:hypothetical protein
MKMNNLQLRLMVIGFLIGFSLSLVVLVWLYG